MSISQQSPSQFMTDLQSQRDRNEDTKCKEGVHRVSVYSHYESLISEDGDPQNHGTSEGAPKAPPPSSIDQPMAIVSSSHPIEARKSLTGSGLPFENNLHLKRNSSHLSLRVGGHRSSVPAGSTQFTATDIQSQQFQAEKKACRTKSQSQTIIESGSEPTIGSDSCQCSPHSALHGPTRATLTSPTRIMSSHRQGPYVNKNFHGPTTGATNHSSSADQLSVKSGSEPVKESRSSHPDREIHRTESNSETSGMLPQPKTSPITQGQLVREIKSIYTGLMLVERECAQADYEQASNTDELSGEQWQALIALHRVLLYEYHDFFLASHNPSASSAIRELVAKYAIPFRLWRYGIFSFLELLRHGLPQSLDYMLTFIYLAYSIVALLKETNPAFDQTWNEYLGDLARYRMAIERTDLHDKEIWLNVARMWYNKAADHSPYVGRIQHHLAVLARPNILRQLFYYSKALVSVDPFQQTHKIVMTLFEPFLESPDITSQRYPVVAASFIKASCIQFKRGSVWEYDNLVDQFLSVLNNHIEQAAGNWRFQGSEIAVTLCALLQDYGNTDALISKILWEEEKRRTVAFQTRKALKPSGKTINEQQQKHLTPAAYGIAPDEVTPPMTQWRKIQQSGLPQFEHLVPRSQVSSATSMMFCQSDQVVSHAYYLAIMTCTINFQRVDDENVLSFVHVILAFLWSLSYIPAALIYVESHFPWAELADFLNAIDRSGAVNINIERDGFPHNNTDHQLPEDFLMRGLLWAQYYFPPGFFHGALMDEEDRNIDLPSHTVPRVERCLWLGRQLASLQRWLTYDIQTDQFEAIPFSVPIALNTIDNRSPTVSVGADSDAEMSG